MKIFANRLLSVSLFFFLAVSFSYAQPPGVNFFEGILEYKVDIKGAEASMLLQNKPNNKMKMYIKGGNYIVHLMGGQLPKTFLFMEDSTFEYTIDMAGKRAFKISPYNIAKRGRKVPEAKNMGKSVVINGISCDVYSMKTEDAIFTFYVNDQYKADLSKYEGKKLAKAYFLIKGLEGMIPLKVIKKTRGLTITNTISNIIPQEFDEAQFSIPHDFIIKRRDYRY